MSKRLRAFALTLVAVVATGVFVAPQAAVAAPFGGCNTPSTWNGWNVGACISATSNLMKPDFYVNQKGQAPAGCYFNVWRIGTTKLLYSNTCSATGVGHYGPWSEWVAYGPALCYYTHIEIGPINGSWRVINSPPYCF